jgi:hypothetical protein
MHGDISFVPEVLPIAPRPIAGELISSWLLRVSFANGFTLAELVQGIENLGPDRFLADWRTALRTSKTQSSPLRRIELRTQSSSKTQWNVTWRNCRALVCNLSPIYSIDFRLVIIT